MCVFAGKITCPLPQPQGHNFSHTRPTSFVPSPISLQTATKCSRHSTALKDMSNTLRALSVVAVEYAQNCLFNKLFNHSPPRAHSGGHEIQIVGEKWLPRMDRARPPRQHTSVWEGAANVDVVRTRRRCLRQGGGPCCRAVN